ncbi:helix-turn-helix domain-containing protein [Paenarthrobacter sp. NPDC090522]|uniref:helix-turn-helix domain-containing protein n=1 Tax=Paenarthrobacter sp. NPDC090522 TaxID=3364383 RepID=UPI0038047CC6
MRDDSTGSEHPVKEKHFAENVRRLREERGWSQSELARRMVEAGWSAYNQMAISRTEKNERSVRLGEAIAIAELFDVNLSTMMSPTHQVDLELHLHQMFEAHSRLQKAADDFLEAQTLLALAADEIRVEGMMKMAVEDWLSMAPEVAVAEARQERLDKGLIERLQRARAEGHSTLTELEAAERAEAEAAGFASYSELLWSTQESRQPLMKKLNDAYETIRTAMESQNGEHSEKA